MAARISRFDEPRPRDEHVIVAGSGAGAKLAPGLAELALHAAADDGAADCLRHGEAEPGLTVRLVTREPVQDEKARRDGPALAVDGVEVPRA